ncbi:peptide/nickel transport system ATP-binding protein [Ciceribacter lividus]|uniref:Peptide/nickel transport system ATP-binding protein n=1 Tax=Ciceribacter lividus TaxID=1197950 RepID=A0A6I7HNQ0_9HYPH|nr:ABC transporter ATP-binding protein [Ciceribacter lividus]RCW25843.1 peptide/nickel transport system ATP-binding protein [Ciceribacter lividus]
MKGETLLAVDGLTVSLHGSDGAASSILRDVSFDLREGETLGIVGESGSGKSLLALAIMGLLPTTATPDGRITFEQQNLLTLSDDEMCHVRGNRIGMIFQEPATALNPAMTIGDQVAEGLVWHRRMSWRAARAEALRLLDRVRIPDAHRRAGTYPHEMSGGQRQRVGIAIALALEPALLIADEPTTALDVTVQAEILDVLDELVRDQGMALIFVSHDLGVVANTCERMIVMYAGRIMEEGATRAVLADPANPYTRSLLHAVPRRLERGQRLATIPGAAPHLTHLPRGCAFSDRCPEREVRCREVDPPWISLPEGRGSRCIHDPSRETSR